MDDDLVTDIELDITFGCPCGNRMYINLSDVPKAIYTGFIECKNCNRLLNVVNYPIELEKLAPRGDKYRKHKWLEKRYAEGCCIRCGKERDDPKLKCCARCREKYKEYATRKKIKDSH